MHAGTALVQCSDWLCRSAKPSAQTNQSQTGRCAASQGTQIDRPLKWQEIHRPCLPKDRAQLYKTAERNSMATASDTGDMTAAAIIFWGGATSQCRQWKF